MEEISASWSSGGSSFPHVLSLNFLTSTANASPRENSSLGLEDPQTKAPSSYGRVGLPGSREPQSHRPHVVGRGGGGGVARSRVSGSIHSRPWEEGGGRSHLPAPLLPRCSSVTGFYPKLNHGH